MNKYRITLLNGKILTIECDDYSILYRTHIANFYNFNYKKSLISKKLVKSGTVTYVLTVSNWKYIKKEE